MTSVRYAFDELNRLTVVDPQDVLRPVRTLQGRARTDGRNRLVYRVEESAQQDGYAGPRLLNFDGTWTLGSNHELALTLHEARRRKRHTLYLKGAIVKAEANALIFALRRSQDDDLRTAERLTLSGRWQADEQNRLSFLVQKAGGSEDRLTLQGGWTVGKHHELLYRYRQRQVRGRPQEHTLLFNGAWDITRANRLIYRLAGSQDSAFEFEASLQSPSLHARKGRIVYQVGVGLSRSRTQRQRVALFGRWKLHRDLSVSFEIPYADGRVQAIRFGGEYALNPRDRLTVMLHSRQGERLGLGVTFTRKLARDARLFLRLRKDAEERSAIGGVQVRF